MVQDPIMKSKGTVLEIISSHNANFKRWSSLLEARGIKKESRALVSGKKLVQELTRQMPDRIEEILLPPKGDLAFKTAKQYRLSGSLFNRLDVIGTGFPIAVVRLPALEEWKPEAPQGLELIVSLSDPGNLGAVIRSAEAFGARRIVLTREAASPFLPKAIKASSLSCFRVPLVQAGSIRDVSAEKIFALDMEGESIRSFAWPKDLYLLLGEEGQGIPEHLAAQRLKIPMQGQVESLNATVAASLAMYSYQSKL